MIALRAHFRSLRTAMRRVGCIAVRISLWIACAVPLKAAPGLAELFNQRLKCVVAVEYVTQNEVERRPTITMGTVIDSNGTVILQPTAIDARSPIDELRDFRIYLAGDGASTPATYLGQDAFTGWHFVRASESIRAQLVSVTNFVKSPFHAPELADFLWGIGMRNKDEDFLPYLMQSHLALTESLPQHTGITQQEVAAPGLPVFDHDGNFVGLAASSFGQTYLEFGRGGRTQQVTLVNVEESSAFVLADDVVPYFNRTPKSVSGRPMAWLGAYGLEPMDRDVAKFLNLGSQSGVVVSEVLEGSPAEKAGLHPRDIILALDGKPVPQLNPPSVIPSYVDREVDRRHPGDRLTLTVLRGADRLEVTATLGDEPKLLREADRKYFDRLGITIREFVYGDAVVRRVKSADRTGVVVEYVKPNSASDVAGVREEDWIREIDGAEVKTFGDASARLAAAENDATRTEVVLLVSRGTDTAVLRVKLK